LIPSRNYPIVRPTPFDAGAARVVSAYLEEIYDIDEEAWDIIHRRKLPPDSARSFENQISIPEKQMGV
jgi:hypothetical protein